MTLRAHQNDHKCFSQTENGKCQQMCGGIGILIHSWWECKIVQLENMQTDKQQRGLRGKNKKSLLNGHGVSFQNDGNISELDRGGGCTEF